MRRPRWLRRRHVQPETYAARRARIEATADAKLRDILAAEPGPITYARDHLPPSSAVHALLDEVERERQRRAEGEKPDA